MAVTVTEKMRILQKRSLKKFHVALMAPSPSVKCVYCDDKTEESSAWLQPLQPLRQVRVQCSYTHVTHSW